MPPYVTATSSDADALSPTFLGIDGGGTKTRARLAERRSESDSGDVESDDVACFAVGESTGSNPYSVGWDAAFAAVRQAVDAAREAAAAAGRPARPVEAAVIAVAGCASPEARDRLHAWAESEGIARRVAVVPDTEPLFAELPPGASAIGLIAGTGSAAVVRRPTGETTLVGGWGYLIDDAGSGYALGQAALRWLARTNDAGGDVSSTDAAGSLGAALLRAAGAAEPARIKSLLYEAEDPRAWTARLAPTVLAAAEAGDAVAERLLDEQAAALAELAEHAARRLDSDAAKPTTLLTGGLLTGSAIYRERLVGLLDERGWQRDAVRLAPDAAQGCVRLAAGLG